MWVDQRGEFYNNVFEKWLSDNDINMYSTYNEGKSVVAERLIRTLKNKLHKHMTATAKNIYHNVLDDVVNKKKKKLYGPFLWMGFNCLKARATSRRQFTFYH